jgi:hypothetical protein
VARLAPLLGLVRSPVERGAWAERVALAVGTRARHVEAAVAAGRRGEDPHAAVPIAVRRVSAADERKLRLLARVLLDHPELALRAPLASVEAFAPGHPLVEVAVHLAAEGGRDLEALAAGLSPEARSQLFSVAVDEAVEGGLEAATQGIQDLERWLHDREDREQQRELTDRMRRGDPDAVAILHEKQRAREQSSARWREHEQPASLRGTSTR